MAIGDQYFDKVVLALPFDADGIKDWSISRKAIQINGSVSISAAQSKFGGYSALFDGSTGYLSVLPSSDFYPSSGGAFTVEAWVYLKGSCAGSTILTDRFDGSGDSIPLAFGFEDASNTPFVGTFTGSTWVKSIGASALSLNTWYHLAGVYDGTKWTLFVNGVAQTASSAVSPASDSDMLYIGRRWDNAAGVVYFNGHIDDLRVTKNIARFSANFTPATSANPLYMAQVQGTVKDGNGNLARRLVRAHRRSDGIIVDEKLSDPSTGAFTLNTPDTSKYYAVVHDSDAWITYLPFNGDNNSTIFPEWGGKAVTPYGNAKISTAQSKFGGASLYLDGAGDYLTLPVSNDLAFGSGDFTIESWVRLDSLGVERALFDNRAATTDTGLYFYVNASNQLAAFGNNAAIVTGTGAALTSLAWHHVALVKSSGTMTLFLNGVNVGSAASSYVLTCPSALVIGRKLGSTTNDFAGYIDDLRIQKGKAQYVGNFIPASVPHFTEQAGDPYLNNVVLGCHFDGQPDNGDQYRDNVVLNMRMNGANGSTTILDDTGKVVTVVGDAQLSTTQKKFGTAALYLDGAGDYLTFPTSSDFGFGTGNFTVEMWFNTTDNDAVFFDARSSDTVGLIVFHNASGIGAYNAALGSVSTGFSALDGLWHHLAVCRNSGVLKIYVDGVEKGSWSSTADYGSAQPFRIGTNYLGNNPLTGYIDDVRVTKGVARYTSTFTPPTAELPALSRRFHDVITGKTITANGDATISSAQSKFGGFSAYFDGSGDYLTTPEFGLYGTDFTVECFIRLAVNNTNQIICATYNSPTQANTFTFSVTNAGKLNGGNGLTSVSGSTTLSAGVWYHVAFVYSTVGATIRIYLDGVLEGTITSATVSTSTSNFYIGGSPGDNNIGAHWLNGYIDDFRITKGLARYTTNFTPPGALFPETLQTYGQQNAMIYDHLTPV